MSMGSDMYRQQILDHYKNPRNYGELDSPTFSHRGYNPSCGDEIEFDVELAADGETIEAATFHGEGCAISQAAASMLGERLPGMTLADVEAMDRDDMTEMLGGDISPMRIKCAVLAEKVVQDGIEIYRGERDPETTEISE
ncbi:iron-sulfur cluster assembly scaffold protein [Halodesulfurarchaeum sp. HSR-GB]|uniref:iron-sulfur cluster assembly scaffold protein n=1 Tax=Halodesulfurarchaeum sp. HSR-GB TaxID=3074077 RepID=UPI002860E4F1|nr:iron-sulfur cluster assembly scaffold protein [Halodesulfurarchaeum sp. HSR-GB]MDR5656197.1 iron-sulfur cluster assembly scaffold protein [Halodesulfurarchaeum sp. HSR-GB]